MVCEMEIAYTEYIELLIKKYNIMYYTIFILTRNS